MPARPLLILDPEIVVPSPAEAVELRYWERMIVWAEDTEPRLGPSTLAALEGLAIAPPDIAGLPRGDFWTILSKYMSRGFGQTGAPRVVCETHMQEQYRPIWGAATNARRMIDDIRAAGPAGRIVVSTIDACWNAELDKDCSACESSKIAFMYGAPDPVKKRTAMARTWRESYLDEHPRDLTRLEEFASKMFPSTEFSPNAWKHLRSLSGAPEVNTAAIITHLAVLNDYAPDIWIEETSTAARQAAFGAVGVSCSPESPNTHKDKKAMAARDFVFEKGVARCEWHTKIRPEVNRIYFAVEGRKVLIGTIVDHLPT